MAVDPVERLDRSFTTMFVIVSVINIGLILPGEVARGETNPAANSFALLAILLPTVVLVIIWWIGEFYNELAFRLGGWLILFTMVFSAFVFLSIYLGVDQMLGFNVMYLVLGYVITPIPSLLVLFKITRKYCTLLNRRLTRRELIILIVLCVSFVAYWLVAPWDLSRFSWSTGG